MSELTNIPGDETQKPAGQGTEQGSGEPEKHAGGRPSIYTQDLADRLCARLSDGESMRTICRDDDMPSKVTVFYWLRTNEEFLNQYTRAKQESADALADDIQDIAEGVLNEKYDPHAARVAMDGKKWIASKLKPKVYGDKLDMTTGGEKINRGMTDAELNAILARAGNTPDQAGASPQA